MGLRPGAVGGNLRSVGLGLCLASVADRGDGLRLGFTPRNSSATANRGQAGRRTLSGTAPAMEGSHSSEVSGVFRVPGLAGSVPVTAVSSGGAESPTFAVSIGICGLCALVGGAGR